MAREVKATRTLNQGAAGVVRDRGTTRRDETERCAMTPPKPITAEQAKQHLRQLYAAAVSGEISPEYLAHERDAVLAYIEQTEQRIADERKKARITWRRRATSDEHYPVIVWED